ncbi:MAG: DNA starvation/stationary phase protection protein Dps [Cyanobacteriota bacterium]|nr:DNA starvation/stationary phase protection protein Dps [Cyanobacteriota bacterium]
MLTTEKTRLYASHIDLDEEVRSQLIKLLNQSLADTLDLKTQVKQAHWNVKGINFIALHEMFDKFATTLEEFVDMIAERVTALGGVAMGTTRIAANNSTLPEYNLAAVEGKEHLEALLSRYGQYASQVRSAIDRSGGLGDADTADLYTEISRQIDKDMWFIEAHLQG